MPTTKTFKGKRAKGGKGKADSKQDSKATADQDVKTPRVDSVIWELRLKSTNQDLSDCQKAHFDLVRANDYLSNQLHRVEKDTSDLKSYWEREAANKERKISTMEGKLKTQAELALEETNKLLSEKYLIQNEVKKMKEKEAQMEQELNDIRVSKENADKDHSENLITLENKIYEEKTRLEREILEQYNQQIELLKQEHSKALTQLERALQMEHDCQSENLKNAITKSKDLEKMVCSVVKENVTQGQQKERLESIVKNKTAEMKVKNLKIYELMARVSSMEKTLQQEEVKIEQMDKKEKANLVSIQGSQVEMEKMQKVLAEQEKEMQHVKQLASTIVKKHKEMEKFFREALDHVRQEITANRLRYKKEALQDYRRSFREATAGKIKFPPIQTFHESPHSTNSVYLDMEAATKWSHVPNGEIQLSDLTWEQKEQVLQRLFASLNGEKERKLHKYAALCTCSKRDERVPGTISRHSPESIFCPPPNI
ncbi:basal body-orientation factor 1-like [Xenentodon cancila]